MPHAGGRSVHKRTPVESILRANALLESWKALKLQQRGLSLPLLAPSHSFSHIIPSSNPSFALYLFPTNRPVIYIILQSTGFSLKANKPFRASAAVVTSELPAWPIRQSGSSTSMPPQTTAPSPAPGSLPQKAAFKSPCTQCWETDLKESSFKPHYKRCKVLLETRPYWVCAYTAMPFKTSEEMISWLEMWKPERPVSVRYADGSESFISAFEWTTKYRTHAIERQRLGIDRGISSQASLLFEEGRRLGVLTNLPRTPSTVVGHPTTPSDTLPQAILDRDYKQPLTYPNATSPALDTGRRQDSEALAGTAFMPPDFAYHPPAPSVFVQSANSTKPTPGYSNAFDGQQTQFSGPYASNDLRPHSFDEVLRQTSSTTPMNNSLFAAPALPHSGVLMDGLDFTQHPSDPKNAMRPPPGYSTALLSSNSHVPSADMDYDFIAWNHNNWQTQAHYTPLHDNKREDFNAFGN